MTEIASAPPEIYDKALNKQQAVTAHIALEAMCLWFPPSIASNKGTLLMAESWSVLESFRTGFDNVRIIDV